MSDELLQVGVESEDVLDVQGRLLFLGYDPGQVSGHFSTETEAAVMQYQQATGQSPTGTLDPFAVHHLREYSNAHHYGQPPNAEHHHTAHHTAHHGHGDQGLTADQWQIAEAQLGGAATVHVERGSEVEASPGDYYDNLHHTLNNVSTRAIAQAAHNDAALIRACQAFKSEYALPRLHELEGRITGEDLAKQVTRSLLDMAGIRVCGTIGSGVAKWFAEQVSVGLARKASAAAKSAVSNEGTAKALAASFEHIITEAETHNAVYAETARELMAQALAPVFDRIQVRQPLADDDAAWVARFYGASPDQIDEGLEEIFGIPGPARTTDMELAMYERLVADFTELFLTRTEGNTIFPKREDAHEAFYNDPHRRAEQAAHEARAARATELEH